MSTTETTAYDYTTVVPRHHHNLYLEDGNIVIQVENAIFKIHRYFLAKYSTVLHDMLSAPQQDGMIDGTDEKPLSLTQDTSVGWELLFDAIYNSHPFEDLKNPSGEDMLMILPIAHKYCMERIEQSILDHLKQAYTTDTYVDLMVASQIVDSESLYRQALQGLISSTPKPNLSQAKRIGVEVHHAIMEAALSAANNATSVVNAEVSAAWHAHSTATDTISSLNAAAKAAGSALATVNSQLSVARSDLLRATMELEKVNNRRCKHCGRETDWRCSNSGCRREQPRLYVDSP